MGDEHGPLAARRIVVVLDPGADGAGIPVLCARLADLVRQPGALIVCDAGAMVDVTIGTVEALARLRLTARRLGAELRLRHVPPRLRHLIALTGLDEVFRADTPPLAPAPAPDSTSLAEPASAAGLASALELKRQAEQWEQPLDIEEVRDAADPAG